MKKVAVALAVMLVAGIAYAASFNSVTYYQADSAGPPTPLSVGLPMNVRELPLKQITVTVSDFSDGGNIGTATTDDDYLRGFTLHAWRKVGAGQLATARDAGWTRMPELDISYAASAAALAQSTSPAANLQASRSWSASLASVTTRRCDSVADGGLPGLQYGYEACTSVTSNGLPVFPSGSQLRYQAPPNGVMGLDAGVKPFLITIDGVY